MTLFNSSKSSVKLRLKFKQKGFINHYWSVEVNEEPQYQIKFINHGFQLMNIQQQVLVTYHVSEEGNVTPYFTSVNNNGEISFIINKLNKIQLNRTFINQLNIGFNNFNNLYKIKSSKGLYQWRGWDIMKLNEESLVQFIWFGKDKKNQIGGVEMFADFTKNEIEAFIAVVSAYFFHCDKEGEIALYEDTIYHGGVMKSSSSLAKKRASTFSKKLLSGLGLLRK